MQVEGGEQLGPGPIENGALPEVPVTQETVGTQDIVGQTEKKGLMNRLTDVLKMVRGMVGSGARSFGGGVKNTAKDAQSGRLQSELNPLAHPSGYTLQEQHPDQPPLSEPGTS